MTTRVPLRTRLFNTAQSPTALPQLPYDMTVGAYIEAVDIINPGCEIGSHIEKELEYFHTGKGETMSALIARVIDRVETQGVDILYDLLVYPFLNADENAGKEGEKDD